jgi:alkylhydroperoxidase family enzyme
VIQRTCARCGCEYEWGVHAAVFGPQVGLTGDKLAATVTAAPDDDAAPWTAREAVLVALVDELHDTSTVSDHTWTALAEDYDEAQLVELVALAGQYHAVSFMANALGVEREDAAQRFPAAKAA